MRSFKKMTAVVMAVATLATSMVPFSVDALYYNENSKFTYDLAVESESDDMIKVTFYTTYNPGTAAISMALKYDEKNLECVKSDMDIFYHSETLNGMNTNARNGMAIAAAATISGEDYFEPISFSYYFKIKDDDKKRTYDFSACVYQYISNSENIRFGSNISNVPVVPDETTKTVEKDIYTRKIGDVIPDGSINMSDVTELLGIGSFLNACTGEFEYPIVETISLNNMLTMDRTYTLQSGTTGRYRDRLKNSLYANNVPFAEIADCDQNGKIEQADGQLLITYYAQVAAGQNPESLINTELSKVVYADITM